MYKVHLLPALFGDSILIEYGPKTNPRYILIDGGPFFAFEDIIPALRKVAPKLKELELLVVTHVDINHIDCIITMLNQQKNLFTIKEVWFNGYPEIQKVKSDILGALQGEYLTRLIKKMKLPHNTHFGGNAVMVEDYNNLPVISLGGGMELTLLSPGREALVRLKTKWKDEVAGILNKSTIEERWAKEKRYNQSASDILGLKIELLQKAKPEPDNSEANQSSIAFIGKYDGKTCLFAGDATSDYLLKAIDPMLKKSGKPKLQLDAWKLAHHGSKKSNLEILMQKIDSKNLLVSTDGSRYHHPNEECIAKLLGINGPDLNFYFNYYSKQNKVWEDAALQKKYKYKTFYPAEGDGITFTLKG